MENKLCGRKMFMIYITHEGHHHKKQNRTVNYPAICKKKFQLALTIESSCSVHSLPWTFPVDVFLCILDSPVNCHLPLLPLVVILLCSVNTKRASLSGSYLVGWNGDPSACLNPSVKTGGGWVHTDSLIYLQPLQSPGWELGDYWGRQHANNLNDIPWRGLSSGQTLLCLVTE